MVVKKKVVSGFVTQLLGTIDKFGPKRNPLQILLMEFTS